MCYIHATVFFYKKAHCRLRQLDVERLVVRMIPNRVFLLSVTASVRECMLVRK